MSHPYCRTENSYIKSIGYKADGRSGRATTHYICQRVRQDSEAEKPRESPCKPAPLSHFPRARADPLPYRSGADMSRIERFADATLYHGDCREILPAIGPVNLVVTSPPYDRQRDYGKKIIDWRSTVSPLSETQGADAQVFVNLGIIYRDGEVHPYWDGLIADMRSKGWRLFGWYVWDQGPGLAGNWKGRPAPSHEWIFHFNKTAIEPNKTTPCLHAGKIKKRGPRSDLRNSDGRNASWSSGVTQTVTQPFKVPDSTFRVMRQRYSAGAPESLHPAVFPLALPSSIIAPYSHPGQLVCDPFMGSGTTGVSAVQAGRRFVGIEIDPTYFDLACSRLETAVRQNDMFKGDPAHELRP